MEQKRNSEYKVTEFSVTFFIFIRNVCWRKSRNGLVIEYVFIEFRYYIAVRKRIH